MVLIFILSLFVNVYTIIIAVAVFLGYNQYWPGQFMVLWFYVQEHPKAQPAVVLVLKRLRRRGHGLVSSKRLGEAGNRTCHPSPGLQEIGLSPTPLRLYLFYFKLEFLYFVNIETKNTIS